MVFARLVLPVLKTAFLLALLVVITPSLGAAPPTPGANQIIKADHPLVYYHGRWDSDRGTWWAGSGFKLSIRNLKSLTINLGPKTSGPFAPTSVSLDDGPFVTYNLTSGTNKIDVRGTKSKGETVVKVNVEGWQQNRIQLTNLEINREATLHPYKPSKKVFQFIGDSLSSGQYLERGINQAWPFLVSQDLKAEHRINTQPGATLTDMESYGNAHGLSYQFFSTEDTGFFWTNDHNYTTPWNFSRETPKTTYVVIHAGANDSSHQVEGDEFVKVYVEFLKKLRKLYPRAPIFVFTPWGWPSADGNIYYYQGQYERVVKILADAGDKNVHLVNTEGWVTWDEIFHDNSHLHPTGHRRVADLFLGWLEEWETRNQGLVVDVEME